MLTTSLPVIKDYTEEEINELIKKIPTLKKEDIAKIKDALKPVEKQSNKEKIIDLLKTKRSKLLIILGIFLISQDAFDIVRKINNIYMIIKSNL